MIEPVAWTNKWYVENGRNFRHIEAMPCQHPSFDIPLYALPEGFAIVPVEPTEAMIEAYLTAQAQYCLDVDKRMGVIRPTLACAAGLKAMLTAAKGE